MVSPVRLVAALLPFAVCAIPAVAAKAPVSHAAKPRHAAAPAKDPKVDRWIDVGGFGAIALYRPHGDARGLVLFASGDGGWSLGVTDMAHEAAALGYWVAGFSTPRFLAALDAGEGACSDADGVLARLADNLVHELALPASTRAVVVGYSSGATVVYAALAADAGRRFGGGISLGFCPDLVIHRPFCPGTGGLTAHWQPHPPAWIFDKRDTVVARWRILQGEADQVCDPAFAPEFADGQADAQAIMLPKVGHGFGVPKNWLGQYRRSLRDLLDAR